MANNAVENIGGSSGTMAMLLERLQERGPEPDVLLSAIGVLDSDIEAVSALLAPILNCTELLLENREGNLTHTQMNTLAAMRGTEQDITAVLETARALTVALQAYWRLAEERHGPQGTVDRGQGSSSWRGNRMLRRANEVEESQAFLTAEEVAEHLELPLIVVHSTSALKPIRVKDRYLYRTADVERYCLDMVASGAK